MTPPTELAELRGDIQRWRQDELEARIQALEDGLGGMQAI